MEKEEIIKKGLSTVKEGQWLYSPICGEVEVMSVCASGITVLPLESKQNKNASLLFCWNGRLAYFQNFKESECLLFPSEEVRSWDVYTWKEGDVLESMDGKFLVVFEGFNPNSCVDRFSVHFAIKNPKEEAREYVQHFEYFNTQHFFCLHHTALRLQTLRQIEQHYQRPINLYTYELHPFLKRGDFIKVSVSYDDSKCVHTYAAIFQNYDLNSHSALCFVSLNLGESNTATVPGDFDLHEDSEHISNITISEANEIEKAILLDALKDQGLRWDENEKKLVETAKEDNRQDSETKVITTGKFKPFDKVLVRDINDELWQPAWFAWELRHEEYCYGVAAGLSEPTFFRQCIPFNEKTAHLVGTTLPYEED